MVGKENIKVTDKPMKKIFIRLSIEKSLFIVNPTLEQLKDSDLELVVAGTKQGVLMVESEANQLSEDQMLEAVVLGQKTYDPLGTGSAGS